MDENALRQFRELDWRGIAASLLVSAIKLATRYGWTPSSALPGGQSLEGLVHETISEIWETPSRLRSDVSIEIQLAQIVRQKLWNLRNRPDSKRVQMDDMSMFPVGDPPEDTVAKCRRSLELLYDSPKLKGKDDHQLVVTAMMDGALSLDDLVEQTGLSRERMYQINRELRQFYPTIAEKLQCEEQDI
jgi:hypothetical protein